MQDGNSKFEHFLTSEVDNGGVEAAARFQMGNRQSEIGNEFTLPPLASNDLFAR
jgi:hypothetical protein